MQTETTQTFDRSGRGSGRTTRQLKQCIQEARDGWRVFYICRGRTEYAFSLASHLLDGGFRIDTASRMLRATGGGFIEFVSDEVGVKEFVDRFQGIRNARAHIDHACRLRDDVLEALISRGLLT